MAQNLKFVAPMPEQIETPTMYFPEVSGGTQLSWDLRKMHGGGNLFWDECYESYFYGPYRFQVVHCRLVGTHGQLIFIQPFI